MNVVADSNILFAALMSGSSKYLTIFRKADVYIPDFALSEIAKYENRILEKTKSKENFRSFTQALFAQITVIPKIAISPESVSQAYDLCRDIDAKDALFVSLSIELSIPLWTNDRKLANGLRSKGYTGLIGSDEMFSLSP